MSPNQEHLTNKARLWARSASLSTVAQRMSGIRIVSVLTYVGITLGPVLGLGGSLLARATSGEPPMVFQPRTWRLLCNSLGLATMVSAGTSIAGMGTAIWLASGHGRLRDIARWAYVAPLLIPPYIYALTWMTLLSRMLHPTRRGPLAGVAALLGLSLSPYGFWGTALVLSLGTFPIVTLLTLAALDGIEPEMIETARVLDDDRHVWQNVVLPLALPALLAGTGLVFALTLVEYGVPALFQYNVYAIEIYAEFSQSGDPVRAMGLALPLFVPAVLLIVASQSAWGQTPLRARPGGCSALWNLAPPPALRGWMRISSLTLATSVLAPVVALLVQTESVRTFWHAVRSAQREIWLSLALALGTAAVAVLLAWPSAQMLSRRRSAGLWALHALPLAVPAPLYAIGLIYVWNRPLGAAVYGTPVLLGLAHVGRFLPFAVLALVAQFRQIDPTLHQAARLYPVGLFRRAVHVHLALVAPGLLAAGGIVSILSLGELGASLLLVPAGSATLSLRLFNLLHYGASGTVAGLALCVLVLGGGIGGLTRLLDQRMDFIRRRRR